MRRALSLAGVVLRKELLDSLRERRAMAMALLFPLLGPAVLAMTLWVVGRTAHGAVERPLALPVAGAEHAPELVAFLRGAGVEVTAAPADPERAVRAGERDVVLVIPPRFGERLRAARPAPVRLVLDGSRQSAQRAISRARALLDGYGRQLGMQRLLVRGVHPGLAQAILVEETDLSTPESRAALVLSVLPYFVILSVFVGGMATAIDTTTGERERKSLEPLLANPVPRSGLALAKIAATALFAAAGLVETLIGFGLVPLLLPAASLGFTVRLDPALLLRTFLLCLPLVALLSALQILIAARARGFKAAQTTLSLLMMVPVLPGMMLAFLPLTIRPWMALVPTLGEQLVAARLLRGEPVAPAFVAGTVAATAAWAVLLGALAVRAFQGERIMFGR
ncbi:MAG TPA: ABC transporter permease subunit [Anaeromyxobacteraceae bacterium]|nr:ABC transporter permease subunit [Anaeromyxobacteraceae bacterium]